MTVTIVALLAFLAGAELWDLIIGRRALLACIRQEIAQGVYVRTGAIELEMRVVRSQLREMLGAGAQLESKVDTLLACSGSMFDNGPAEDPVLTARVLGGVQRAADRALARQQEPGYPIDEVRGAATPFSGIVGDPANVLDWPDED